MTAGREGVTTGEGSWLFSFHPYTRREKVREERETHTDRHIYIQREKTVE